MRRFGHHAGQCGAVLGIVQALRCASTRYAGLRAWTTPARRSKCSTHVMAEEPVPFLISILTAATGRRMFFEVSPVPLRTPSAVASGAERRSRRPQGKVCSIPQKKNSIARADQHARSPRLA